MMVFTGPYGSWLWGKAMIIYVIKDIVDLLYQQPLNKHYDCPHSPPQPPPCFFFLCFIYLFFLIFDIWFGVVKRSTWKRAPKKRIVLLLEFRSLRLSCSRRKRNIKGTHRCSDGVPCEFMIPFLRCFFGGYPKFSGSPQKSRSLWRHVIVIHGYKTN